MDKIDRKLLATLLADSRTSTTQLAKAAGVSREVATYRLERFIRKKLIRSFVTRIDISKLGYGAAALFVNIAPEREAEFADFLQLCPYISWVARWTGVWSYGMSIVGKNPAQVDARFHEIYDRFKDSIKNHRFVFHKHTRFFHEKFLGQTLESAQPTIATNLDETDKRILKVLSLDARIEYAELSRTIGLTAPAIAQRIKKMENIGVIERYSVFLDLAQLGLQQYSAFVDVKDVETQKLLSYLSTHPRVSFTAEYLGDPYVEFGVFVKDPYELRLLFREIESVFPIKIQELSLFEEVIQSIGPPVCVFE